MDSNVDRGLSQAGRGAAGSPINKVSGSEVGFIGVLFQVRDRDFPSILLPPAWPSLQNATFPGKRGHSFVLSSDRTGQPGF